MGQRVIEVKNPFTTRKIQYMQLSLTLIKNIPSQLLMKTEEDVVDNGKKKIVLLMKIED